MPASAATRRDVTAAYPSRSISCSAASSRSARVFEFGRSEPSGRGHARQLVSCRGSRAKHLCSGMLSDRSASGDQGSGGEPSGGRDGGGVGHRAGGRPPVRGRRTTGSRCSTVTATRPNRPPPSCASRVPTPSATRSTSPTGRPCSEAFGRVRAELGPVGVLVTSAGIESFDAARRHHPEHVGPDPRREPHRHVRLHPGRPSRHDRRRVGVASSRSRRRVRSRARRTWRTTPPRRAA